MRLDRSGRAVEILLAEDNPGDARLTREALKHSRIPTNLTVAKDGEEALDILVRQRKEQKTPRPDLMLLDLNMPRLNGFEVLRQIRSNPDLETLPVVVLTSSDAERDVIKSYRLRANCYISKPGDLREFSAVINQIEEFWVCVAHVPSE